MTIEKKHCQTMLEVLAQVETVPVSGPLHEVRDFANRVQECREAVQAYSDALYPDSDQDGVAMLRGAKQADDMRDDPAFAAYVKKALG